MKNLRRIALLVSFSVLSSLGHSQTVKEVLSFSDPLASSGGTMTLAQGRDGRLYGTTQGSESTVNPNGTIFRVNENGHSETILFAFNGDDGSVPVGGITLAIDGNYYGTTWRGGSSNTGVLFKASSSGAYSVLHEINGTSDGFDPHSNPIQASDGNLYGEAADVVYKYVLSTGEYTPIFTESQNGSEGLGIPTQLIQASDGNLYGVTQQGGASDCGTVFAITTAGALVQLYSFPCGAAGSLPNGRLIQGSDGNIYGTTESGGNVSAGTCAYGGCGTVFKLSNGAISTLYTFSGPPNDGGIPLGGLVQGTDGNLYGTTYQGGANDFGTLFQITTGGQYKVLYSFVERIGADPGASLLQHTNGKFYGTASAGGRNSLGSIYSLDMGLGPFIALVRYTGRVGQQVEILGQGLTGATSVTVNAVPATSFKVVSDTFMTAVVPTAATTGPVVVTTPTGTLTSNRSFQIVQ